MKWSAFFVFIFNSTLLFPKPDYSQVSTPSESLHATLSKSNVSDYLNNYFDEKSWNDLFPHRYGYGLKDSILHNPDFYSFKSFVLAARMFPGFLSEGNEEIQKRELSAFLASIAYETGGGWNE